MALRRKPGLDPDTKLEIDLHGTAIRRSTDDTPQQQAIEELQTIMGDRNDLAAKAAGTILGAYIAQPGTSHPNNPYAAALIILAAGTRIDADALKDAFDTARANASRRAHSNP